MKPARRSNPLSVILGVLLIVALLALAWFVWQWTQEGDRAERLDQEVTTLRQQAADAIAPSEEAADEEPAADTTDANDSDSEQILTVAQAYEKAQPSNQGSELRYEIAEREGDFARVSVNSNLSGHALVLKKVDDQWVVVLSGQQFDNDELQRFGVPATLVRE